jgi:putative phosphoesterase
MRIGVCADIHGNIAALAAVLTSIEQAGVDQLVCLGDVAELGPAPAECVDRLRSLAPAPIVIRGNTDRELAERRDRAGTDWSVQALGADRLSWLRSLPTSHHVEAVDALFVHASPRSDTERLGAFTDPDQLAALLASLPARRLLHGHTHQQYLLTRNGRVIANPGSVGLPFDGDPHAAWALVTRNAITLQRTAYPVADTIDALARSTNPARLTVIRRLTNASE